MAIDFNRPTFGAKPAASTPAAADERPKAEFWLNIGFESEVIDQETGKPRFVSLPQGIPLDTMEELPTNSRNNEFAAFQSARNDLLEQLIAHAQHLQPGEDCVINLSIQLRRVNAAPEPINPDENPFTRKLSL